jgi:hypothetical protein
VQYAVLKLRKRRTFTTKKKTKTITTPAGILTAKLMVIIKKKVIKMPNYSEHLTPDDWGDPVGPTRTELLIALTLVLLYPLCFGSGMLVAHFFHL